MEINDLRIFAAVARTGSITQAARELHTVQSNVSSRVRAVERDLRSTLLRRHARGVALTTHGERLLPYADQILRLIDEAQRVVGDSEHPTGPLRIGSLETTAGLRLPSVIAGFVNDCPDVDLTLTTGGTDGLIRDVVEHRLDGALVTGPVPEGELETTPVFNEELVLVTAPSIDDPDKALAEGRVSSMLVFREGCSYRRRLENYALTRTSPPPRTLEFGTLGGILGCVAAGLGITMLPRAVVSDVSSRGDVRPHALPSDFAHAETVFVRRHDVPTTAALRHFLAHVTTAGMTTAGVTNTGTTTTLVSDTTADQQRTKAETSMPLVRIDLVAGRTNEERTAVADATHQALVTVLQIPERDRFQLIHEHQADRIIAQDAGLGFERSANLVLIHITTQQGRSTETKQRLFREIAGKLGDLGISGEDVFIDITENGPQDWSFAHGRAQYVEGDLAVPR